jgi:ribonuclease HI
MRNVNHLVIVTDACCKVIGASKKGNCGRGEAACGFIFLDGQYNVDRMFHTGGKYLDIKTCQEAEYMGLVYALEQAKQVQPKSIEVWMDSALVVNQMNERWQLKAENLKQYYLQAKSYIASLGVHEKIIFRHHKRDVQLASMVDEIANQVLRLWKVDHNVHTNR